MAFSANSAPYRIAEMASSMVKAGSLTMFLVPWATLQRINPASSGKS
jgi:hypothetical protein